MKVLVKRASQAWLLFWKPLTSPTWYPIHYNNVVFVGEVEQLRSKINRLLQGESSRIEFEAFYSKSTKTLALWA
jgi:hypothetical protein